MLLMASNNGLSLNRVVHDIHIVLLTSNCESLHNTHLQIAVGNDSIDAWLLKKMGMRNVSRYW